MNAIKETGGRDYTDRLARLQSIWWKRWLNVQAPYRWNIRRLHMGFVLDIGCGLGRNLLHLDGCGVGIDHNPHSVDFAKTKGLTAYLPGDFCQSQYNLPGRFDSILLAHVAEHMRLPEVEELLRPYVPLLRPKGKLVIITPQENGFASDPTHVQFMGFDEHCQIITTLGLEVQRQYSFPFPRWVGSIFRHNEFVTVAKLGR